MHIVTRRSLLRGSSYAVIGMLTAASLAGCAGLTAQQIAQKVVTDVNLVAAGLVKAIPSIKGLPAQYQAQAVTLEGYITEAQTLAGGLSSSMSATAAKPIVAQVVADVNAAVNAASSLPLPPPYNLAFEAAAVLLPVIENGVGLPVTVAAPSNAMTPAEARAILHRV